MMINERKGDFMREIDNNSMNNVNFKGIQKPSNEEVNIDAQVQNSQSIEINDLSKMPAASLGKSQISSDSIENDMKFFEKNPLLARVLNDAVENYSKTHTGEETIQMIEKMHQEFVSKK